MLDRIVTVHVPLMFRVTLKEMVLSELSLLTLEETKGQMSNRGLTEKAEMDVLSGA